MITPKSSKASKQLLINGYALVKLGSSRMTSELNYLVYKPKQPDFVHNTRTGIVYYNAAGPGTAGRFFAEIWQKELNNIGEIASPQSLLELQAFLYTQHCRNGFWQKADDAEYDIKVLVRLFRLTTLSIVANYISAEELAELEGLIRSTR